jgi:cysteine synthase
MDPASGTCGTRWDNPDVPRYDSILDAIGETPLVGMQRLSPNPRVRLWAKLEGNNPTGSTKDRIALAMVEEAERSGELTPDKTLLEPTSGNTGIALAMVARRKGYRLTVVLPDNASPERIGLLRLFGAEIVFSDGAKGTNGSIEVARALAKDDTYYMPFQYGNPANPRAHEMGTAREIIRDLPTITHFVAGMGTGGTLTGNGRALHRYDPAIRVIAAEPELGDLVYGLRSLDEGFVPPIFDPNEVNRKFLVNSTDSLRATRELTSKEGIFAGISSGAVIHVAQRIASELAAEETDADVVCLLPDGGWKYLSLEAWAEDLSVAEKGVEESLWW